MRNFPELQEKYLSNIVDAIFQIRVLMPEVHCNDNILFYFSSQFF